ncbi:MAG: hypothetical protein Q7T16_02570 [Candidatus Burarchaeum sp.]|nr:hypothetical protein [Candidatus Burarchaeum sp.]MDO8339517.1 hypothetical protein [Candidatus Burarchaeum sp.]
MLEIRGSNRQVLEAVERAHDPELLLKRKVSTVLLAQIMQKAPVSRIMCSPAIYGSLPRSAVAALEQMGVEIAVERVKRGRPHVHAREKLKMIEELHGQGFAAAEIAHKLHLPLRTVYYHLRRPRI